MVQLYVKGASKKALNEQIAAGQEIFGTEYKLCEENRHKLNELPTGTVVKVFEKFVGGNPYAKSYGTWNKEKNKIL